MKILMILPAVLLVSNLSEAQNGLTEKAIFQNRLLLLALCLEASSDTKTILPDRVIFKEPTMEDTDTTNATLAAVERFNAAFNRHDVDAVMAAMTEDCIFENTNPAPDGTQYKGAAKVRAYWEKFFKNNPDAYFETEEIITSGNRCIVRWIYRKTKDGQPWHLKGVDIFKVKGGKVYEKFSYVKG